MPTIQPDQLERFAISLIAAGGATPQEADVVGKSLVRANLFGYEAHGVMRIPFYIQALKDGEVVSKAPLQIMNESATRIVTDANWGFGQVQANDVLNRLIAKTKQNGLAVGTIIHCGHVGRLGEYCEAA